jgi:hypothetical protein
LVPIEETIRGFNMIMDGEVDEYPEAAFNLKGSIDEAIEAGKKMLAEEILNNHAPIVSSLEHGTITIVTEGVDYRYYDSESGKIEDTTVTNKSGATLTYQIEGGFIEVLNNEINLLVTGVK